MSTASWVERSAIIASAVDLNVPSPYRQTWGNAVLSDRAHVNITAGGDVSVCPQQGLPWVNVCRKGVWVIEPAHPVRVEAERVLTHVEEIMRAYNARMIKEDRARKSLSPLDHVAHQLRTWKPHLRT